MWAEARVAAELRLLQNVGTFPRAREHELKPISALEHLLHHIHLGTAP